MRLIDCSGSTGSSEGIFVSAAPPSSGQLCGSVACASWRVVAFPYGQVVVCGTPAAAFFDECGLVKGHLAPCCYCCLVVGSRCCTCSQATVGQCVQRSWPERGLLLRCDQAMPWAAVPSATMDFAIISPWARVIWCCHLGATVAASARGY